MTREQAEAAGWDFSFRPLGSEFCDCRSINMSTRLRIESPPETTAGKAIDAVLPAITAIERYPDAVRLLEEARMLIGDLLDESRYTNGEVVKESHSWISKLEAHHAGT